MMNVPCERAHVFSSECGRPFAQQASDRVCGEHPENAALSAAGERRSRELDHVAPVRTPECRRVTPQHRRVGALGQPLHTRIFLAFEARSSSEMRELSASSTREPSFVTR